MRGLGVFLGLGAAAVALLAVLGCCRDPYELEVYLVSGTLCDEWRYFEWNGVTEARPDERPMLIGSKGGSERRPALELFDVSGDARSVPKMREGVTCEGGCPHKETLYDLSGLPPGDYTLVIYKGRTEGPRLVGSGAPDPPWVDFRGSRALVTTLRLLPAP